MAILTQETAEISGGFSKEIDSNAIGLMMNVLQQHQYAYPIKSTIRELVSNGLDSITEKNIARAILSGEAKEEDYFVQREGDIYKDSRFNAAYYYLDWFSPTDTVEVIYTDGGDMGKDNVVIRDHGVGLGGKRLENYFNLGYSSKRLLSKALGKFGIGAKSPLSTGCPYYTITSRYNGMEFKFNVYAHRVESIVPATELIQVGDTTTLQSNASYTFSNGYTCYYWRTSDKNGLEIEIGTKKHHKAQYLDAVTSQLMYFKNVKLFLVEAGIQREVPVKADILYEDDMIVLASNSSYSKPHILLNGVNYGYVNFQELELEDKMGNIGIKVDPDKISINPSRESLIWDDKTREVVVQRFQEVVSIAQNTINQELKERDFLRWLRVCSQATANSLWSRAEENTVIGRLARIVDMSKIELSYPVDSRIRYNNKLLDGLWCRVVKMSVERTGSKIKKKVEYYQGFTTALSEGLPLLIHVGPISNRRNKYILTHVHKQGFILLQLEYNPKEDGTPLTAEDIRISPRNDEANTQKLAEQSQKAGLGTYGLIKAKVATLHNYIHASQDKVWYENIVVPEDFKANELEEEEEVEEQTEEAQQSAEERRKLTGMTVLHTPRVVDTYSKLTSLERAYEMQKIEMPVHLTDTWKNEEVFWSNQDFEPLLHTAALLSRYAGSLRRLYAYGLKPEDKPERFTEKGYGHIHTSDYARLSNFYESSLVRLIKVAQNNVKYYKDFKHITKFFKEIRNKTITMSNVLIRWNTARLLKEKIADLAFLRGFEQISPDKAASYNKLTTYVTAYWRPMSFDTKILGADDTTTGQLISHLDKVGQFQLFVRSNPDDKESIAQLAVELFNPQKGVEIENGKAIDTEMYDMYLELVDWCQPVKTLMNIVSPLVNGDKLTQEQEQEIRHYFQYRGCPI